MMSLLLYQHFVISETSFLHFFFYVIAAFILESY